MKQAHEQTLSQLKQQHAYAAFRNLIPRPPFALVVHCSNLFCFVFLELGNTLRRPRRPSRRAQRSSGL
jgi:hypothetical protein